MENNREIILEALLLHDKGEYADKIIKSILDKYSYLERFERSFINRVYTGTIERRLTLDFIINGYSSVKVNKLKPVIRAILRMSVYQLIFMDSIPDSAVINEAVKLAKRKKFNGLTGFVNGVLRKIAREKSNLNIPSGNTSKDLSIRYSMPEWLCDHFIEECGVEKATEILKNSLAERPVIIRTNISKITPDELRERLKSEGVTVENISNDIFSTDNTSNADSAGIAMAISDFDGLSSLDSFNDGLFCVQDLSSQMILEMDSEDSIKADLRNRLKTANLIVDVCAAPGGKTCQAADLTAYLGNDNCQIVSRDLTDYKADKIDENIERCRFTNVETEVFDALSLDEDMCGKADIVIADLPCSGLGVIGRKSDIKYRITKDDLMELSKLQREILKTIVRYVKDGGMLVYSTCTVNKKENDENAYFIESELGLKKISSLQIYNDTKEHDGFYISRFVRE